MRILITLAVVAGLAACGDDGRSDQDRSQEQDQVAVEITTPDDTADDMTGSEPAVVLTVSTTTPTSPDTTIAATPASDDASVADPAVTVDELDADEVAGLLWMREEEQLAHDVYTVLGEQWDVRVFDNIAASEQRHIESTIDLLDRYGIADPAAGNEPGTFTDPTIQQLYDDLVARGMQSLEAALEVGATIEELDIADLRDRAAATDEAAIDDVYARLERGSRNHLRAFVGELELLGVEYEPTVLADADEIVASPIERGPGDR